MTEKEAVKHLNLCMKGRMFIPNNDVLEVAIQALEEVQQYREGGIVDVLRNMYAQGYAKGIDDFVNLANECSGYTPNCIEHDLSLTVYTIHQIAEKLKGGAV